MMKRLLAFIVALALGAASAQILTPQGLGFGFHGVPAGGGGGATSVFNYSSGFTGVHSNFVFQGTSAGWADPNAYLTSTSFTHQEAGIYYYQKLNIQSFTTQFSFANIGAGGWGFVFIIQNDSRGTSAGADSNGISYFALAGQNTQITPSVAVTFNAQPNNSLLYAGATPSTTGLYVDGIPFVDKSILPEVDLAPQGIDFPSGDLMDATITYDGTTLTMDLHDTVSGARATYSWPVNIPSEVGANTAWVGIGASAVSAITVDQTLNSWSWDSGYNTRLASPTFSPAAGSYTTSQTVTIGCPSGATCYYTTNGKPPTIASSVYSSALTVSSSEIIRAIAVESNYTNSLESDGNYQIQSSGSPTINFPSGFASANGLIQTAGVASISGSNIDLLDGANQNGVGAATYAAPVTVSTFSTTFTMQLANSSACGYGGQAFVLQDVVPSATDPSTLPGGVTGGLYNLGLSGNSTSTQTGFGYEWIAPSVVVKFDSTQNSTGLYLNGAAPSGSSQNVAITGITLNSGDPIAVTLSYDGTTLSLSMHDNTTSGNFSYSWPVNITSTLGASTAYAGFTASHIYLCQPTITNWTM